MEIILRDLINYISNLDDNTKIEVINKIKLELHKISPLFNEPVDCVLWVKSENVISNDYNPNKVAPPEMELLKTSIDEDGYTQPIVTMKDNQNNHYEVIDGFHRWRIAKENMFIQEKIKGYLPVTIIRPDREGRCDRIASTIRHNRARGKHTITGMTSIIVELKKRNHSNEWIAKELGMDADEILRLSQISGLAEMFKDKDFSEAWTAENILESNISEDDLEELENQ